MSKPSFLSEAVGYWDFRSRSFKDLSGNGNDITTAGGYFTGDGFFTLNEGSQQLIVPSSDSLSITGGTLVAFVDYNNVLTNQTLISKSQSAAHNYNFRLSNGALSFNDSTNTGVSISGARDGSKYLAINFEDGEIPEGFVDGVSVGNFSGSVSITASTENLYLGSYWSAAANRGLDNNSKAYLIFPRQLTATEHAELYCYLSNIKFDTKTYSVGHEQNNTLVDGDMENEGVDDWNIANGTLEKVNCGCYGKCLRIIRDSTSSAPISTPAISALETGRRYRITGLFRADGVSSARPRIRDTASGLDIVGEASNEWQFFQEDFVAGSTVLQLRENATNGTIGDYIEFTNVIIIPDGQRLKAATFKTSNGVYESVANQTEQLENSPFKVSSGSFKITRDTINGVDAKVIECVTAGTVYIPTSEFKQTPAEASYGEWEFYINKINSANNLRIYFYASEPSTSAAESYDIRWGNTDMVYITRKGVNIINGGEYNPSQYLKINVTRNIDNEFELFINNVSVGTGTESTYNGDGRCIILDMDAGDKIAYSRPYGIKKYLTT